MANIWSIAKLTFRLPFRSNGGQGVLLLCAGVAAVTFAASQGDGTLSNELPLRLRYALHFSMTLLSLSLLWYACVCMRADIDAKRLHLLTSYPVKRRDIFLGKWLGLFMFSLLGILACLVTVGLCSWVLLAKHPDKATRAKVLASTLRVQKECFQDTAYLRQYANEEATAKIEDLRLKGELQTDRPEAELNRELRVEALKKLQVVEPYGARIWRFDLGPIPRHAETFTLVLRCYASEKRLPVRCSWGVGHPGRLPWGKTTTIHPYSSYKVEVPMRMIPENGRFFVAFKNESDRELVFYHKTSVRVYYDSGSLWGNLVRFVLPMAAHLAAVIAVGLTVAAAFTMSVASFVGLVLYCVALAAPFFERFLADLASDGETQIWEAPAAVLIRIGLFFTTGLEQPNVIAPLSGAIAIDVGQIGMNITRAAGRALYFPVRLFSESAYNSLGSTGIDLATGFVLYLALVAGLGMFLLTRKELDRLH